MVSAANFNSPEQTVIAGATAAVERASAKLKEAGAKRVVPLPVSAPFHCALMEPVKARLAAVLARCTVSAPAIPVVTNVEARPNPDAARVVPLLLEQVDRPGALAGDDSAPRRAPASPGWSSSAPAGCCAAW